VSHASLDRSSCAQGEISAGVSPFYNALMCGRYRLSRRKQILAEFFPADYAEVDWEPRYNIAPTQQVPVVRQDPKEPIRRVSMTRWGLIPFWTKAPTKSAPMINARAETAAEKPAFRELLQKRRCLVPADGFYEWSRHEAACVIVRRAPHDRTCHPIGSTLRGMAIR
jgi:putative SOS response-associated peptidase YedK